MTSASRVSRFSTRKSAWWTAWSLAWPLKRWLTQMTQMNGALDPKTQELLIPNLADCGRQLLLHTRECHGLSSLHVTWDTGFGRDWYAITLGQWHIAILYLFCYLVDNLVNNVRNTLWAFEWPCEYLKDNCQWRTYKQVCQTLCVKCHNA